MKKNYKFTKRYENRIIITKKKKINIKYSSKLTHKSYESTNNYAYKFLHRGLFHDVL